MPPPQATVPAQAPPGTQPMPPPAISTQQMPPPTAWPPGMGWYPPPQAPPPPPPTPTPGAKRPWYKGPLAIIAIIVVLVAGATLGTVLFLARAGGIDVSGTVADAMTGKPIASAQVKGDGHSAVTDAQGAFKITGVAENSALTVSAKYYTPASVKAATTALTVRLTPIPVKATVTSALTGGPLTATITLPDGTAVTAPNGAATVYRVGGGDQVTVSAVGYKPAKVTVGENGAIAAVLQPTPATASAQVAQWASAGQYTAIANWLFASSTGYQFTAGPSLAGMTGVVWWTSRTVVGQNVQVALVVLAPNYEFNSDSSSGRTVTSTSIGGVSVYHVAYSDGTYMTIWVQGKVMLMVAGTSLTQTDAVMGAMLRTSTAGSSGQTASEPISLPPLMVQPNIKAR